VIEPNGDDALVIAAVSFLNDERLRGGEAVKQQVWHAVAHGDIDALRGTKRKSRSRRSGSIAEERVARSGPTNRRDKRTN
jgi:uncharacterized membrane-anchored protein